MKWVKTLVIAVITLLVMYHLYDRYLRSDAIQIGLTTKDVGRIVYCRYCDRTISEEPKLVRVPSNEAWRYRREPVPSVCADCGAKMSK